MLWETVCLFLALAISDWLLPRTPLHLRACRLPTVRIEIHYNFWYNHSATGHAALLTHFQAQQHNSACGYGMLARQCTKLVTAGLGKHFILINFIFSQYSYSIFVNGLFFTLLVKPKLISLLFWPFRHKLLLYAFKSLYFRLFIKNTHFFHCFPWALYSHKIPSSNPYASTASG